MRDCCIKGGWNKHENARLLQQNRMGATSGQATKERNARLLMGVTRKRETVAPKRGGATSGEGKKENVRQLYESGMVVASPPDGNARLLHQNGMVVSPGGEKRRKM